MRDVEFKRNRYWRGASNEKNNFWLKNDYVRDVDYICEIFELRVFMQIHVFRE